MSRFPRLSRFAAVTALAVSTVTVFSASPAVAATGSLAAASNGFTVTWTNPTPGTDFAVLLMFTGTHSCANISPADFNTATYGMYGDSSFPASVRIAPSPATYTFGSPAYGNGGVGSTTIAAGSYSVCLLSFVDNGQNPPTITELGSLAVTITDPGATTTTTTAAPITTTTAAGGAATPAFTG